MRNQSPVRLFHPLKSPLPLASPLLKITRKQIAAAAGVSVSTVGMILSGQGGNYNAHTRQRVMEAARQLGYQPSINARALRLQRSLLIGVLLNESNTHLSARFLLGVQRAIADTDYSPVVFFTNSSTSQQHSLDHCLHRQVDALIVNCSVDDSHDRGLTSFKTALEPLPIPVIEVFGHFLPGVPKVNPDSVAAGRLCATHLADLGHSRIALLTHEHYDRKMLHQDAWEQFCGCQEVADARHLKSVVITPKVDFNVFSLSTFVQAGHEALDLLLAEPEPPTAVVCHSDLMAYGLYRACRERGLRVPQDLSIIGNRDLVLSAAVDPPLTTTCQNAFDVGFKAAANLLQAIEGTVPGDELVAPSLIVRQSTKVRQRC